MADFEQAGDSLRSDTTREVDTPVEFMASFVAGESVVAGGDLYFRFVRMRPGDRESMAANGAEPRLANDHRRLVFVGGHDAATAISGLEVEPALYRIGWSAQYVDGLRRAHVDIDLVAWNGFGDAQLATWENVLAMISDTYSDHPELVDDIRHHWAALASRPFEEYGLDAAELDRIEAAGPTHPEYVSLAQYLQMPREMRAADARHLRRLLVFLEHLGPLFTGTGQGPDGFNEYIALNQPLAALGNVERQTVLRNSPD